MKRSRITRATSGLGSTCRCCLRRSVQGSRSFWARCLDWSRSGSPGNAEVAMTRMARLMVRLGLEVNTTKTRIARLPEEQFDFLGYTVGRFYGKDGRSYFGTRPSKKAVIHVGKPRGQSASR